jgi:hypothetical protein
MTSFVRTSLALCAMVLLFGCADPAEMPQGTGRHTQPCLGNERFDRRCDEDGRRMNSGAGGWGLLALPVALIAAGYYNATAPSRADQAAARRVIQDETRAR